jgi:trehalose synthase-fused probable maltokinase
VTEQLRDWLREQRWFAAKDQGLIGVEVVEQAPLVDGMTLALVQAQLAGAAHELYQLLLNTDGGLDGFDVLAKPACAHALLAEIESGGELQGRHGRFFFRRARGDGAVASVGPDEPVRPMGAEQSNSSVVFGERLALKVYRRLEPGINPELEMLRFLTAHGYPNIAPLHGWFEYEGEALAATLGVTQRYLAGGTDGWQLALEQIPHQPARFLAHLGALGEATARLHTALASDTEDPAFSPRDPSSEFLNILRATLDDQLERLFGHLPEDPGLAPLAGLEQGVRECIRIPNQGPIGGKSIRIHGDYHLGQTLHTQAGWTLLDFEGEPARPLNGRRQKRSPLRDVAGMLRSFSYANWAVKLKLGLEPPTDFEVSARSAFLEAYLDSVDRTLLPTSQQNTLNLLATFELEKALYELQYELANRPDWVAIPVAGILRLVQESM